MKIPMLQHSGGKPSVSFTMAVVSWMVVTLWLLLSMFEFSLGPVKSIRPFSGSEAMAYLSPLLALYWGRRASESSSSQT